MAVLAIGANASFAFYSGKSHPLPAPYTYTVNLADYDRQGLWWDSNQGG
jgi:hypothetical protein